MIVKDEHGIVCQHPDMDGGDSISRQGILALSEDAAWNSLCQFKSGGKLVRHPYQAKWNDPKLMSRDQLVCAVVAQPFSKPTISYAKSWFINKDFLDPAVKLYLYKSGFAKPPAWLKLLGTVWMFLALIWNTKIKPKDEMNQFTCMCIVMGQWWCNKLISWHPHIEKTILNYWSGWRDQHELGVILVKELFSVAKKIQPSSDDYALLHFYKTDRENVLEQMSICMAELKKSLPADDYNKLQDKLSDVADGFAKKYKEVL
jgi:hypothetical protein